MTQPHKMCPNCQEIAPLNVPSCPRCGRPYRTRFDAYGQPIATQSPPAPQSYLQPTQYISPQYPPLQFPIAPTAPQGFVQVPPGSHSATAAILLSVILPGSGQAYNKQVWKGVLCFCLAPGLVITSWFLFIGGIMASLGLLAILPVMWLLIPVVWFGQVIDAAIIASKLNRGEVVGLMQFF